MKKLLLVLILSLGLMGNNYADVRHCSDELTQSLGLERCYSKHEHDITTYYENGQKEFERLYDENQITTTIFFESGQKEFEWYVKVDGTNDKNIEEEWTVWFQNGQMQQNVFKQNNHEKQTFWDENGLITFESNWKVGECVSGDCPE